MKKIFTFAAVLFAALTVNATVYNFGGITADQITTDGTIGEYEMDGKTVPSISVAAAVDANVTIAGMNDLVINYKHSEGKSNILKFAEKYMQTDGKNVILNFSNVPMGATIELVVAAKGSTDAKFEATAGAIADANNPESVTKIDKVEDYVTIKFMATASTVSIKETSGGYRIVSATVGGAASAVDNALVAPKAQKVIENGQILIVKDGVKYNVLGAIVAE